MEFNPTLSFEIDSSLKLYNKLLEEYSDFDKQHLNPRFAVNCAVTSWHLTDWTYLEFYKNDDRFQNSFSKNKKGELIKISGLMKYNQYVIKQCPELEYMRLITNGIKHCILNDKSRKEKAIVHQGDYSTDYSRHDFDVARFVIEIDENTKINFEHVLLKTIEFWNGILNNDKK